MPRRRAKELVSGQDSSLKRQKIGPEASNKVDGTGLSVSTLAASEDFDRSSRASSKSNRHLEFSGMSKLDSPSTDGMSKDLKSVADNVFKHDTSPTDCMSEDVKSPTGGTSKGPKSVADSVFKHDTSPTDCMSEDVKSPTGGTSKGPNSVVDSVPKGGTSPTESMSKDVEASTNDATPNKGGKSIAGDSSLAAEHRALALFYEKRVQIWKHSTEPSYYFYNEGMHGMLLSLGKWIHGLARSGFKFTSWEALGTDTQEKLSSWSVKAKEMLDSEEHRVYVYEAWIWHILDDNLFSGTGTKRISKNELWESYHRLQEALIFPGLKRPDPNNYMNIKYRFWKQITFDLLMDGRSDADTCATTQQITDLMESELGPVALPDAMRMVAIRALAIYGIINSSAKEYVFTFGHPDTGQLSGFPRDYGFMEVNDWWRKNDTEQREETVDIVLSPLVRVDGTVYGTDIGKLQRVRNMVVATTKD